MNIYKISQCHIKGYDTFSDAVVVAANAEDAQRLHPNGGNISEYKEYDGWTSDAANVDVVLLGMSYLDVPQVVCASFHAG